MRTKKIFKGIVGENLADKEKERLCVHVKRPHCLEKKTI